MQQEAAEGKRWPLPPKGSRCRGSDGDCFYRGWNIRSQSTCLERDFFRLHDQDAPSHQPPFFLLWTSNANWRPI